MCVDGKIETSVYCIQQKLPTTWYSKIPKQYKHNVILGDFTQGKENKLRFPKTKVRN